MAVCRAGPDLYFRTAAAIPLIRAWLDRGRPARAGFARRCNQGGVRTDRVAQAKGPGGRAQGKADLRLIAQQVIAKPGNPPRVQTQPNPVDEGHAQ